MAENNTKTPPRGKAKGVINFPPFEVLDEASHREVRRFQVHPLGSIQDTCERIPYNSGKKDFFSKTGREGFEAFHYDFKVPGDDTNYTVMWDYNVGLVRMTSFFKCRGYSKTTPAKMLNQNPGLKDITYSITGGSIKAQGYWMPFACAKAICATFCHKIAGALIPLFGPRFPYECIPEKAPGHGRMIINPEIVARAKSDATALFRPPPAGLPSPRASRSVSPMPSHRSARAPESYDYHSDYDRRLLLSPYTDTDVDYHPVSERYGRRAYPTMPPLRIPTTTRPPPLGPAPAPTPLHSPGWTAVNQPHPHLPAAYHHRAVSQLHEELLGLNVSATANPWLSAIPRSPTPGAGNTTKWQQAYHPRSHNHHHHPPHHHHQTSSPMPTSFPERGITLPPLRLKRRFDQVEQQQQQDAAATTIKGNNNNPPINDDDADYDAGESQAASRSDSPSSSLPDDLEPAVVITTNKAPPPSPASGQGSPTKSTTMTPSLPIIQGNGGGNDGAAPRRASERDAAIMLMHMMRGSDDSSSSSGSAGGGSPTVTVAATAQSRNRMGGRDGDDDDDDDDHKAGSSGGGNNNSSSSATRWGGKEEEEDDADAEAVVVVVVETTASSSPRSAAADLTPSVGRRNTRAKRRRIVAR
ncbi:hypothetical protein C8A00DRAFT_29780 [Chaetomidium leptoderma]|uniref:HTH APSES-type domain-containing protein n=1 Tax=Chaetomidium leptoderma TaxID=669021 RepID=A0AAN6VT75_9PEZI|nr:hypothetical protein C8A00DRAFT_29780 [Chaetomidium leptoderma]